jgi:hypothetical protein
VKPGTSSGVFRLMEATFAAAVQPRHELTTKPANHLISVVLALIAGLISTAV